MRFFTKKCHKREPNYFFLRTFLGGFGDPILVPKFEKIVFFAFRNATWNLSPKNVEKRRKIDGLGIPKPFQILPKIHKIALPENMHFIIDFCLNFDACGQSRTSEFVRPASVLLAFHTIQLFAFGMHLGSEKPTKNLPKTRSEPSKNGCQKRVGF